MATHKDVGLSEPGSPTQKLDGVGLTLNSTAVVREVMVVGDPETSNALVSCTNVAPLSTAWAASVRVVSGPSTTMDFAVSAVGSPPGSTNSSNSSVYLAVRLTNGTAFLAGGTDYTYNSTADFTGSTVSGPANFLRSGAAAGGSTDHTLMAWGTSNGAAYVSPVDAAGVGMASTLVVPSTASAIAVRPAQTTNLTVAILSTLFQQSTEEPLVSSAAASRAFVYAYSITSTSATPWNIAFLDGASMRWAVNISSGYGGANLAVTPPQYLWAGTLGSSMSMRMRPGSSFAGTSGATISVSYFTGA